MRIWLPVPAPAVVDCNWSTSSFRLLSTSSNTVHIRQTTGIKQLNPEQFPAWHLLHFMMFWNVSFIIHPSYLLLLTAVESFVVRNDGSWWWEVEYKKHKESSCNWDSLKRSSPIVKQNKFSCLCGEFLQSQKHLPTCLTCCTTWSTTVVRCGHSSQPDTHYNLIVDNTRLNCLTGQRYCTAWTERTAGKVVIKTIQVV